jgi:hypothetical protein
MVGERGDWGGYMCSGWKIAAAVAAAAAATCEPSPYPTASLRESTCTTTELADQQGCANKARARPWGKGGVLLTAGIAAGADAAGATSASVC